jgi:hypothetical protein
MSVLRSVGPTSPLQGTVRCQVMSGFLLALALTVHRRGCAGGALALLLAGQWRAVNALSISARSYPEVIGTAWSLALLDDGPSVHIQMAHEPEGFEKRWAVPARCATVATYLAWIHAYEVSVDALRRAGLCEAA